ncbi:MAG: DUF692 domain-containing protein [Rhodospirillales bacterium]
MTSVRHHAIEGCGAGLKPAHYRDILDLEPAVGWFEVHPENYMGAGGPPHAYLGEIRARYPLALHGVGLSIGGPAKLDRAHLDRLKALVRRYEPSLVSEHLAWSTHQGRYFNDLLALPYTAETLALVVDHVDQMQNHIGRTILLENPATYVRFSDSLLDEIDFLSEISRRTGCGLLLDVNNVQVSCTNHGCDPNVYLDRFPAHLVGEIHLAGHTAAEDMSGLLIDSHDRPVSGAVWALFEKAVDHTGPVPTLIEWDNDLPDWATLHTEVSRAQRVLDAAISRNSVGRHVA